MMEFVRLDIVISNGILQAIRNAYTSREYHMSQPFSRLKSTWDYCYFGLLSPCPKMQSVSDLCYVGFLFLLVPKCHIIEKNGLFRSVLFHFSEHSELD